METCEKGIAVTVSDLTLLLDWDTYKDGSVEVLLPSGQRERLSAEGMAKLASIAMPSAIKVEDGVWRHKANNLLLVTREAMTAQEIQQADEKGFWRGPYRYYCRVMDLRPGEPTHYQTEAEQEEATLTPEELAVRARKAQQQAEQEALAGLLEAVENPPQEEMSGASEVADEAFA